MSDIAGELLDGLMQRLPAPFHPYGMCFLPMAEGPKLLKQGRLARWSYAAVLFLALAAVIVSAAQSYRTIDRELTELALSRRASVSYLAATVLSEKLDRLSDIGVALATRVRFRELVEAGDWIEAGKILRSVPDDFPSIERTTLHDRQGTMMADVPEISGIRGQNFSHRDWYQGAIRTGEPYISPVFKRLAPPQINVFVAAIPIKNAKGVVLGILVLQVRADRFFDWVKKIEAGSGGAVRVIDRQGRLAAHPQFSAQEDLIDYSGVPAVRRLLAGERGVEIVVNPADNEKRVVAFEPIAKHGWGVVLEQPAASVFVTRDDQLRRLLSTYGFVSLCVICVVYLVSRIFVQRRLVEEGQQAQATLEHAVVERTAQLEKAKNEMHDANQFLDSVIENIPNMIFVKDAANLKFMRLNRAGEHLLGYSKSDLLGRNDYDFFPREEADFFTHKDREVLKQGKLLDIPEESIRTRSGEERILHTKKIPVVDEQGKARYLLGISEDITERKRGEWRVAAQHAVTRVLAESNTPGEAIPGLLQAVCESMRWEIGTLWRVDQSSNVLHCVEIWHMPSFDAGEFKAFTAGITFAPGQGMPGRAWQSGKPFWVSNLVSDPAFPRGMIGIKYGLKAAFGFPIRLRDEVLGVIDFFGSEMPPLDDDLSQMFSAIGSQIGQFIERKRAEAAVRQSEEDMRFLHSVTLEISQSEDSRAAFAALLRKVCDFTGWAYGQVWMPSTDGSGLELSPAWYGRTAGLERFRLVNEQLVSVLKTGLLVQVWTSKEPSWVWDLAPSPQHQRRALILEAGFRSWMGFPVLAGSDVIAVIEFFEVEQCQRDERLLRLIFLLMAQLGPVIQRKRVAEEIDALNANLNRHAARLEAANRELESFSYSVSHDLRSPLRAIDGFARILKEDYSAVLDSEGGRLLDVILNSSQKMGRLIDDLLDFSRLGRKPLAISHVDMTALAAEVLQQIEQAHGQLRPRVVLNAMPAVQCDPALIRQAWANLLSNAIKFSGKSDTPVVEVIGYSNGSDQIYCVKDNGAGFDMQYYDKLFGVFQRLHSEEEFPGTGVGLAIVQRVVSRHGGRVWAEGEVGKGATFYFSLPMEMQNG